MSKDSFGDRMKAYEKRESVTLMPFLPILVRLDGKRFSKWTKGLERPYDKRLTDLMVSVTKRLVEETGAVTGYTQSDEITLVLFQTNPKSEVFLGGRVQKMTSVLASMATAWFNEAVPEVIPEKAGELALFDCRVWSVPSPEEAANAFLWREQDATRNSIQGAARSVYSHKACHKKSTSELRDMLRVRGINWNDYPSFFKRGTYVQRVKTTRQFTIEEIDKLPPQHEARKNPYLKIERTDVRVLEELPPLGAVANRADFLCTAAKPVDERGRPSETIAEIVGRLAPGQGCFADSILKEEAVLVEFVKANSQYELQVQWYHAGCVGGESHVKTTPYPQPNLDPNCPQCGEEIELESELWIQRR